MEKTPVAIMTDTPAGRGAYSPVFLVSANPECVTVRTERGAEYSINTGAIARVTPLPAWVPTRSRR